MGEHVVDKVPQLLRQVLAEVVILVVYGLEVRYEHAEAAAHSLLSLDRRAAQNGQREQHGYANT